MRPSATPLTRAALALLLVLGSLAMPANAKGACQETPRLDPANPLFQSQQQTFGFHDEEIVICSDGFKQPTHIAARLWVPTACSGVRRCSGVLIAHGFGFSKEFTFSDMLNAVRRGLYALSYDVRGQGASGGQADLLGREDIADQAAVLRWFHREVRPSRTAVYGISQGGWLALAAAIFNCGASRAAAYGSSISCDRGGRLVDAVAPVEGPTDWEQDATCSTFGFEAFVEARAYPGFAPPLARCAASGTPAEGAAGQLDGMLASPLGPMRLTSYLDRVDLPVYLATSFADRLVLPNPVTRTYELLRQRLNPYKRDVRLLISDEAHGDIGGNFAATDDIFLWIDRMLRNKGPQRAAPVAIAQQWASDTFRLERDWPIPGTSSTRLYLSRSESQGELVAAPPRKSQPAEQLRNFPMISSPPGEPGVDEAWQNSSPTPIPGVRLDYLTSPMSKTIEVSGIPLAKLWVSSSNARQGGGQVHLALYEVRADGSAIEFARGRRGLSGLGRSPVEVSVPLTVSDYRIPRGSRLMLSIMPADSLVVLPDKGTDSLFIHHGVRAPSALIVPLAPVGRVPPPGKPPSGAAYTQDPIGAICQAFALPC